MHMPVKTRLSRRLKALYRTLPEHTDIMVDLCCDHGALGRAVLETGRVAEVVFNDIHPGIMAKLQDRLEHFGADRYRLSVEPAQNLVLPDTDNGIAILAGVGDEQTITILNSLLTQPQARSYRFVISPATKTAIVRHYLQQCSVRVLSDDIVDDAGRCYEIITVTPVATTVDSHAEPSLTGQSWLPDHPVHRRHLTKLLSFYQAQQQRRASPTIAQICDQYRQILNQSDR